MDPKGSAMLFFGAMLKKFPNWQAMDPGALAQGVQASAYPDRYAGKMPKALEYVKGTDMFDRGGIGRGVGVMRKEVIAPERVLSPVQTQSFDHLVYEVLPALQSAMANAGPAGGTVTIQLDGDAFTAQQVEDLIRKVENEIKGLKVEIKQAKTKSVLDGVLSMV